MVVAMYGRGGFLPSEQLVFQVLSAFIMRDLHSRFELENMRAKDRKFRRLDHQHVEIFDCIYVWSRNENSAGL